MVAEATHSIKNIMILELYLAKVVAPQQHFNILLNLICRVDISFKRWRLSVLLNLCYSIYHTPPRCRHHRPD